MRRILAILACLCVLPGTVAQSQAVRQITWESLVPDLPPVTDPFGDLAANVMVKLHGIMGIRAQKAQGVISEVSAEYEMAVEMTHELERQGVPVERLIADFEASEAEYDRRGRLLVHELAGQFVRLAGYALPLEFSGTGVTEFLLVPFVGACIHVPPPPPNQMIFVRLAEPVVISDAFAPVWVSGRLSTESSTQTLTLVDGKAPIDVGYTMTAGKVQPYRE